MNTPSELVARITQYLEVGGLVNPEMAEHEKVRDLLLDVREFLSGPRVAGTCPAIPGDFLGGEMTTPYSAFARRFIEVMDRTHQPEPWPAPKSTYNEGYHGGDCEKHGRWYGICHGCRRESEQHYERKRIEFESNLQRDLRELADEARRSLSAETPADCAGENRELRILLAIAHAGLSLYTDDGELQDTRVHPHIDYKRDSVAEIERKLRVRSFVRNASTP